MFQRYGRLVVVVSSLCLLASAAGLTPVASARSSHTHRHLKLVSSGYLTVGTDASYPPMENVDPNNPQVIIGADVGLGKAIAVAMGLKGAKFVNKSFDTLITDMNRFHQFDVIMSSMNDTPARRTSEGGVTFVHYMRAVEAIVVQKSSSIHANNYKSMCGHSISVEKATTEFYGLTAANGHCKSKMSIQTFLADTEAYHAFAAHQVDAYTTDYPVAAKYVRNHKSLYRLAGRPMKTGQFYGIAVPKSHTAIVKAVRAAFAQIRRSGQYMRILRKWNVQGGAI